MSLGFLSIPPEIQRKLFFSLKSPRDLADLLEISYSQLVYNIYKVPDKKKYTVFKIPKKSGGDRTIHSPISSIKIIQRKLNEILLNVYSPKPSVFSYVKNRSIVNNANKHKRRRYVFNIDLLDFFPTINFGRVRGLFIGNPYNLPSGVATFLAQICCFNNQLPQGAPTSPIVSNMICAKMDSQLQQLAQRYKCFYTRYADDITFSTSLKDFPSSLAIIKSLTEVEVGDKLEEIIKSNGFRINYTKVRMQQIFRREQVTGLTVNEFPNVKRNYVRQIRAMLHAWDKYGLINAEKDFFTIHDDKHRNPERELPSFKQIVRGKIQFLGMVRKKDDKIYKRFSKKYKELERRDKGIPSLKSFDLEEIKKPHLYTEGITDVNILLTSWKKLFGDLYCPLIIQDSNPTRKSDPSGSGGGAEALRNFLNSLREDHPHIVIGLFDRDEEGINQYRNLRPDYSEDEENDWKISKARKAGALLLPIPEGKELYGEYDNLCIEYYFSEDALNTKTIYGSGIKFKYIEKVTRIGSKTSVEPSTLPETRRIIDGKKIFSESIVPGLDRSEFEAFNILFHKIIEMIKIIEDLPG